MKDIVENTKRFVKQELSNAETGHDWFHTERVWKLARHIQKYEGGNLLVIEIAALLHDIADPKFHDGDEGLAIKISEEFLKSVQLPQDTAAEILFIIKNMSFKNRENLSGPVPHELKIVQDADRLDAIGAIGIARTFNFGGYKNNVMYDPDIPPKLNQSRAEYKKTNGTTINHFYEKLLLLKDMMNTATAKKMAERRHAFMQQFLYEFYREWNAHED